MKAVVWSETARADFLETIDYIRVENGAAARRVAGQIRRAIESAARRNTGRPGRVEGTYEKSVVGLPYVVAYTFDAAPDGTDRLVVLRVIHTSRRWDSGRWPES